MDLLKDSEKEIAQLVEDFCHISDGINPVITMSALINMFTFLALQMNLSKEDYRMLVERIYDRHVIIRHDHLTEKDDD